MIPLERGDEAGDNLRNAAISPDGARIAYVSGRPGAVKLYLRALADENARVVADSGAGPFFSADGQWLGFFAQGKMMKVSVHGGPPVTLCDAPEPRGAS